MNSLASKYNYELIWLPKNWYVILLNASLDRPMRIWHHTLFRIKFLTIFEIRYLGKCWNSWKELSSFPVIDFIKGLNGNNQNIFFEFWFYTKICVCMNTELNLNCNIVYLHVSAVYATNTRPLQIRTVHCRVIILFIDL